MLMMATIRLTDDRNRLISLNGLHFSVSLMFEFVSLAHAERPNPPLVGERNEAPKKEKDKRTNNRASRRRLNPKLLSVLDNKDAKPKATK
eukprot:SAG22_NODE_1551_length_4144_cov_9.739431_3_plen_90_part_00